MSILNVNQIQPVGGGNTITVNASDVSASGATITATSFVGPVTGNVTGNLTGNVTGNVTSSSTSTFSSGINVTGGRVLIGTTNAGSNGTADDLVVANNGSASDQAGITIRGGTSGRSQIFFSDGTSGQDEYRGMLRYDHSENSMQFRTAATERLRIDSLGSAQFTGQNAPSGLDTRISQYGSLLVATTGELLSNARCSIDSGNGNITTIGNGLFAVNTSTYQTGINLHTSSNLSTLTVYSNNSSTHRSFVVYDNGQSGAAKYRAAIYANGRGYFEDGVQFDSSGETLNTYEQGTFDPTISASSSGSITLNGGYNTLSYTKIGRIVHISGQIRVSSVSSPVGNTLITNLPFTAQSTTEQGRAGAAMFYYDASGGSGNYYKTVSIHVTEGTTTLNILNLHSLGGITVGGNDELAFAFSYIAAS